MIPSFRPHPQAKLLAPEVVQTSTMDCGPATLQSLIRGFDLSVSYGRLREACQTTVDGTSISTMDEIARFLGLDTEETMLPADHVFLDESHALPAVMVIRNPDGTNHFVVVWAVAGPWVQVMDPAQGRAWMLRSALLQRLYVHTMSVPAADWRAHVAEDEFQAALDARLARLEIDAPARARLRKDALADPTWNALAALDAATRMTQALVDNGAATRGAMCASLVERIAERAPDGTYPLLAGEYRSAWRDRDKTSGEEHVIMRGAVLLRARGRLDEPGADPKAQQERQAERQAAAQAADLPPELAAKLHEEPTQPGRALLGMMLEDGLLSPAVLLAAVVVAASLVTMEAVLLRGLLEVSHHLGLPSQRAAALAGVIGFLFLGLCLDLPLHAGTLRLGRMLDVRLRRAFLAKLPRLDDRYFRSRLLSDMAERGHSLHLVRTLPYLGQRLLGATAQLVLTVGGIAWIDPASAPLAAVAVVVCLALPLVCQPLMAERELRLRTHAGALGRFYLDALLGLVPIRVHGARPAMQRQQDALLVQWVSAGLRFHSASTVVEGVVALCGLTMAVAMVYSVASHTTSGLLLLVYWSLSLPALGQDLALIARQYPVLRNVVGRLLEPLSTPEVQDEEPPDAVASAVAGAVAGAAKAAHDGQERARGVTIEMRDVTVKAAGNTVLESVDLHIRSGEHLAIVGSSGAGKSSLVGLLLGWHRAAHGTVLLDGRELRGSRLAELRQETAWVDPAVALWNRSFLDNLRYGASDEAELPLSEILAKARLREVLEHLPEGLATELGEGGGMVSGGEGQRTRVGRALARRSARLVVLDEPFRGLDITTRHELLSMARSWWRDATLLLVTHDIAETERFDRVLVIDGGRLLEDGSPAALRADERSRYAALLRGDRDLRASEWSGNKWRRVWITSGATHEEGVDP